VERLADHRPDGRAGPRLDLGDQPRPLPRLLRDLAGAAEDQRVGVAVLIDEAQDLSREELTAICAIVHAANQRGERLVVALAGLPSLPRKLSEAKSYAERLYQFHRVEELDRGAASAALVEPARRQHVTWDPDALGYAVAESQGYPYFLQQFGQEAWNAAAGPTIELADARVGVARGQAALDNGFFRVRWDRATAAERAYLAAMAVDGDAGSASGEVAARLGKKITSLGPTRASLIGKGLIYSPDHGVVAYTVPAMASFVRRQAAE
jgi:hypothetical protein